MQSCQTVPDQNQRATHGSTQKSARATRWDGETPHLSIKSLVRLRERALYSLLRIRRRLFQLSPQRHHLSLRRCRPPLCGGPIQLGSLDPGLRVLEVRNDAVLPWAISCSPQRMTLTFKRRQEAIQAGAREKDKVLEGLEGPLILSKPLSRGQHSILLRNAKTPQPEVGSSNGPVVAPV
jgi:hypothetical protein